MGSYWRDRYYARLSRGRCSSCGARPHRDGSVLCKACAEAMSHREQDLYHQGRRMELRAAGLCIWCAREPAPLPGQSLCYGCREGMRGRYHELRALGLCSRCGADADGAWACEPCRERHAQRRRDRRRGKRGDSGRL